MPRMRPALIALVLMLAATLSAAPQERGFSVGVDLVELDVVVTDRKGKAITDLKQSDFVLKEDGKPVEITTFQEVSPERLDSADAGRSIVLLLDEAGIPAAGTPIVRQIARAFLASASPVDDISVVRLYNWRDEPFGDRRVAEFRIAEYYAGTQPFNALAQEEVLRRVSDLSAQLQVNSQKRKIIVCIGSPFVCNVEEPAPAAPRNLWGKWVDALRATAIANVSYYVVVPSRMNLYGGGLSSFTGGQVFAATYDIGPAIDRILQDASYHYVLGYWPPEGRERDLHSLEVKVNRGGTRVVARSRRAE
jgi:hypothetical protein